MNTKHWSILILRLLTQRKKKIYTFYCCTACFPRSPGRRNTVSQHTREHTPSSCSVKNLIVVNSQISLHRLPGWAVWMECSCRFRLLGHWEVKLPVQNTRRTKVAELDCAVTRQENVLERKTFENSQCCVVKKCHIFRVAVVGTLPLLHWHKIKLPWIWDLGAKCACRGYAWHLHTSQQTILRSKGEGKKKRHFIA